MNILEGEDPKHTAITVVLALAVAAAGYALYTNRVALFHPQGAAGATPNVGVPNVFGALASSAMAWLSPTLPSSL